MPERLPFLRSPLATPEEMAAEPAPFPTLSPDAPYETAFPDWRRRLTRNLSRRSVSRWEPLTRTHGEEPPTNGGGDLPPESAGPSFYPRSTSERGIFTRSTIMRSTNNDTSSGTAYVPSVANVDAPSSGSAASPSLKSSRTIFIDAVRRETPGTDLPRYVAVLDALLAWTATNSDRVTIGPSVRQPRIRFEHVASGAPLWSAQAKRSGAPMLEIHLTTSRTSSTEQRAEAMRTLNTHSRVMLVEGDRLRIGFGALKNNAALAAVLALLGRVLDDHCPIVGAPGGHPLA